MTAIQPNDSREIKIKFALRLESGECIDGNMEGPAVPMQMGDGNLPIGFESKLIGLEEGQLAEFLVPPEDAFGQRNEQNIQTMPRSQFREDLGMEKGLVVSFTDPGGGHLPGVISGWDDESVEVDFNHPLAGKSLIFEVEIVSLSEQQVLSNG